MSTTPIALLVPRRRATLVAQIVAVRAHQRPAVSSSVELNDGTGDITLRFLGRRVLPGFVAGRWLRVEGTPAERSGCLTMLNPLYAFVQEGAHGGACGAASERHRSGDQ